MTSVMDSIRDFKEISFREIEQAAFKIACKTQIKASKESPWIIFIEVDGLHASLQKQSRRSAEEKVGVIHTGWAPLRT